MARAYGSTAHLLMKRKTTDGHASPRRCESVNPLTPS
jgi:hypothetical protein